MFFSLFLIRYGKLTVDAVIKSMICPVCQGAIPLERGLDSLEKLPKNLYLESLLKVVEGSTVAQGPSETYRCVNCQTISKQQEQVCQHCMQVGILNSDWRKSINQFIYLTRYFAMSAGTSTWPSWNQTWSCSSNSYRNPRADFSTNWIASRADVT